MAVEIITGHTGKEHVTAEAAGALHAGVIGTGKYVLPAVISLQRRLYQIT